MDPKGGALARRAVGWAVLGPGVGQRTAGPGQAMLCESGKAGRGGSLAIFSPREREGRGRWRSVLFASPCRALCVCMLKL